MKERRSHTKENDERANLIKRINRNSNIVGRNQKVRVGSTGPYLVSLTTGETLAHIGDLNKFAAQLGVSNATAGATLTGPTVERVAA